MADINAEIEKIEIVPNDTPIESDVEFHLRYRETKKELIYGRSVNEEIYCGGEIGTL